MFDTHCHLNFKAFQSNVDDIIQRAKKAGVEHIVVPGTDLETSQKAVDIAEQHENVYAAVGIHPHHVFELKVENEELKVEMQKIERLLRNKKAVAVGEVGVDRHIYKKTVYQVDQEFVKLQKEFLKAQIKLASKYKKALIIHNREAKNDLLNIFTTNYYLLTTIPIVFHCCEPDKELLEFAIKHRVYMGVDGDVTFRKDKQEFVKKIPLDLLVLETDSPFLLPEPLRLQKKYPNEPKNLRLITEFISKIKNIPINRLIEATGKNSKRLFNLN